MAVALPIPSFLRQLAKAQFSDVLIDDTSLPDIILHVSEQSLRWLKLFLDTHFPGWEAKAASFIKETIRPAVERAAMEAAGIVFNAVKRGLCTIKDFVIQAIAQIGATPALQISCAAGILVIG